MRPPWIVCSNQKLRKLYYDLRAGDLFLGRLNVKSTEEYIFADLIDRKIQAFPPFISQFISRSKCLQVQIYKEFMIPLTFVARDRHDLIKAINLYGKNNIKAVITKQDRCNCGLGIHFWETLEQLYNLLSLTSSLSSPRPIYPLVVQPFVPYIQDVRVIVLGDYWEAYSRYNPYNFRHNLYFGGEAKKYELSSEQKALCEKIMQRGKFPYAHIDLLITPKGETYLSEINLRGGLKGARISPEEYKKKIETLQESFLSSWKKRHPTAIFV